ncbi:4-hydroxybenzoate polyprenyl transferase [Aspergillus ellipticus CBS 707.79]|uniref:4-hydroxybenzoate polyprenyltransferase, mitochondrial n=1 Tax=Aspergillus ellipticus CBS 707.79 TaxID=1448320 RepID=A0A319E221_9EURO|nr:4-hydroxybenzoate polyprenyl transferase [Aspergillus ellipticus CBS 707.79]
MNSWASRFRPSWHVQLFHIPGKRAIPLIQHTSRAPYNKPFSPSIFKRCRYTAANGFLSSYRDITSKKHRLHFSCSSPLVSRQHSATSEASVGYYTPPQKGLIAFLPRSWIPYAELLRLDKPTGTYYLFFPCVYSTLLAATMAPSVPVLQVASTAGLFFTGALVMRGAGCAINDLWDRNLDPHVERTKSRPIARGAISPRKAIAFTGSQLLVGLGILLQFPSQCLWYGIPSMLLVATYPLAKRFTYYPQAVLGLTFSWGAIMGFPALGIDLLNNNAALGAAAALYSSCVAWTILYDMIYAHMDIKDDIAAGIKSIALRHENNTKIVLSALATFQVSLLTAAGVAAGSGPIFFLGSCGSAIISLGLMIWKVQLKNVQNCWWWFKNGCIFTGGGIATGMLLEYIAQATGFYHVEEDANSPKSPYRGK